MNKSDLKFIILSLKLDNKKNILEHNQKIIPNLEVLKSINGYNINETKKALKISNLKLINLDSWHYGTLANFLSKYYCLKYQIEKKIPYMCFLEDDIILSPNFSKFVEDNLIHLDNKNLNINLIRLGNWGEGYITSLRGAERIIKLIDFNNIKYSIDNQLRLLCGKELVLNNHKLWILASSPNDGDCLKTEAIPHPNNIYSQGKVYNLSNTISRRINKPEHSIYNTKTKKAQIQNISDNFNEDFI